MFFLTVTLVGKNRLLIDEIIAIIYTPTGKIVITTSDIRHGLDGKLRTLRQIILEELMIIDAQKLHIAITDADIERFLADLQSSQGFNRAALTDFFKSLGYTYEEGIELLKRKQVLDYVIDYQVYGDKQMIVTNEAVNEYYEQHPQYKEPSYTLDQGFVPTSVMSADQLKNYIDQGIIPSIIQWEEPFTLQEAELAEDKKQLVLEHASGSIIGFDAADDGVELTRLVKKETHRKIPLEEQYDTIVNMLKRQRFFDLLNTYHNKLIDNATIRFTHPEDAKLLHEVEAVS